MSVLCSCPQLSKETYYQVSKETYYQVSKETYYLPGFSLSVLCSCTQSRRQFGSVLQFHLFLN